jgi:hypothetical protein
MNVIIYAQNAKNQFFWSEKALATTIKYRYKIFMGFFCAEKLQCTCTVKLQWCPNYERAFLTLTLIHGSSYTHPIPLGIYPWHWVTIDVVLSRFVT